MAPVLPDLPLSLKVLLIYVWILLISKDLWDLKTSEHKKIRRLQRASSPTQGSSCAFNTYHLFVFLLYIDLRSSDTTAKLHIICKVIVIIIRATHHAVP